MSIYTDAKYTDVPLETKQDLFDEVKADMRYDHSFTAAMNVASVLRPVHLHVSTISVQGYLHRSWPERTSILFTNFSMTVSGTVPSVFPVLVAQGRIIRVE